MSEERKQDRKPISESINIIVGEAKASAGTIGENIKETVEGALSSRKNVVMVRLNENSVGRLDDLVDAGVVSSRSEAAAYLIGEGIKAKQALFDRISDKIDQIRKVKDELRDLLDDEPASKDPD
jgi:hypothetical protein